MARVVFERDLDLDAKKRGTLTGAEYTRYHMKRYEDGTIVLEPRVLVHPAEVSGHTLARLDRTGGNFKKGRASAPIDPHDIRRKR